MLLYSSRVFGCGFVMLQISQLQETAMNSALINPNNAISVADASRQKLFSVKRFVNIKT
jgi:hypothetical protein